MNNLIKFIQDYISQYELEEKLIIYWNKVGLYHYNQVLAVEVPDNYKDDCICHLGKDNEGDSISWKSVELKISVKDDNYEKALKDLVELIQNVEKSWEAS